jgi:hypothetical protein
MSLTGRCFKIRLSVRSSLLLALYKSQWPAIASNKLSLTPI